MSALDDSTAVILTRIEGKLDLVNAKLLTIEARGEDHETRIRALEKRPIGITPAKFLSALAGVATIASAMASVITLSTR